MTSLKRTTTFRFDEELYAGLEQLKERDGIPVSEQVRRALRMWLESKGVKVKTERKRAATRKRP
jgi:Arc/MetJ-type ribon-helix-helix transcriptional regulator